MNKTTIEVYDSIAHRYADTHWTTDFWSRQYNDFENLLKGKRILDSGSGAGRDTKHFISKGYEVESIDLSKGMIEEARKRVPEGNFMRMDMTDLKFEDSSFDGIWCCASLLHLNEAEAEKAISEFARVLKKGGILFVSVKEGDGGADNEYIDGIGRYFRSYGTAGIVERVSAHFKIIDAYTHSYDGKEVWISVLGEK